MGDRAKNISRCANQDLVEKRLRCGKYQFTSNRDLLAQRRVNQLQTLDRLRCACKLNLSATEYAKYKEEGLPISSEAVEGGWG
jgi:hypothetical protein